MRLIPDNDDIEDAFPFAGSLLLAHPSLRDPNFRRSIVLLTAHSEEEGSLGVIVNRPLGKTLGEFDPGLGQSELAGIPLYEGGPVADDQMILVAWKWGSGGSDDGTFKVYFGIDEIKARKILEDDPEFELRGFIGHSGWSEGQLEAELGDGAWVMSQLVPEIEKTDGVQAWRLILSRMSPEMCLLANEPDDPSLS